VIDAPAETAFAFMSDGMKQSHWALGSMNRREVSTGLFVGESLFDGTSLYIRLVPQPELLLVDYYTGKTPEALQPTVEARVKPGPVLGREPDCCVVTLTIWRSKDVSDESWTLHYHIWQTEMALIKGAIERGL
jgi:hypothetical protein